MGNKKATGFLCLRLVPCFAYVGAEDNRKGIPFVKIVSLLCKLIQFLMVALSVTVHKALILLVFLNHPYQSLALPTFFRIQKTLNIYSHSMLAGGLVVTSSTTRFTCGTSLTILAEIVRTTSYGMRAQSAVMKSSVVTARMATV